MLRPVRPPRWWESGFRLAAVGLALAWAIVLFLLWLVGWL
jgi:hypothetical protein